MLALVCWWRAVPYVLPSSSPKSYDADSLDTLAIWFTAVKILHGCGALHALLPLIQCIGECCARVSCGLAEPVCLPFIAVCFSERARRGSTLHVTTIRNENAYYCCIAQVLSYHFEGVRDLDLKGRPKPTTAIRLPGCPATLPSFPAEALTTQPIFVCGTDVCCVVQLSCHEFVQH
jgi:hypothetical protein